MRRTSATTSPGQLARALRLGPESSSGHGGSQRKALGPHCRHRTLVFVLLLGATASCIPDRERNVAIIERYEAEQAGAGGARQMSSRSAAASTAWALSTSPSRPCRGTRPTGPGRPITTRACTSSSCSPPTSTSRRPGVAPTPFRPDAWLPERRGARRTRRELAVGGRPHPGRADCAAASRLPSKGRRDGGA